MAYDDYYDPSVAAVSRPLQGYAKHTLSDSSTRQLQTPYLDPHRGTKFEGEEPSYRGNTPQFSLGGIDQLSYSVPSPFDPVGRGRAGQRTYGERESLAKEKIAGMDPSGLREMTETGLEIFGEAAPLMQARGKNQLQKAVMDKITGKAQLAASKKMVELGLEQFNKAATAVKQTAFGLKMSTQNPTLMSGQAPSSSTTVLDAILEVENKDLDTAESLLDWMDQTQSSGSGVFAKSSSELTAAQESLAGDIAGVGLSMAKEAGRGQGDVGGAAVRTAASVGGAKAGAAAGAALGATTGPAAPVVAPVLAMVGGMLGGAGGAEVGKNLAPAAGQMGAQEISRPGPGLGKMPTMDELMKGGSSYA